MPVFSIKSLFRKKHTKFSLVYSSPWPGDINKAKLLLQGNILLNAQVHPLIDVFDSDEVNTFEWLLDLKSVSDNASRKLARQIILHWIQNFKQPKTINPCVLSLRLSNWISCFDFFGSSADDVFLNEFHKSLNEQLTLLAKLTKKTDNPIALKGLILGYVTLGYSKNLVKHAVDNFNFGALKLLLSDGGHTSRDPFLHFELLKDLLDVRTVLRLGQYEENLTSLIQKMVPILRLLRSGDGGLAHTTHPVSQTYIDTVLSVADVKGRPSLKAQDMGYERLSTKSGLLIMNTKPKMEMYENFYGPSTGVFNFEWAYGTHQYIKKSDVVIQTGENTWLQFDKHMPQSIQINRQMQEGHSLLEANFESISNESILLNHQRQIYLSAEDGDFRGQDRLTLSKNALCAVRFIFPQGLVLAASGHSVMIHAYGLKSTKIWHFHASQNAELSIDYHVGDSALLLLVPLQENKPTLIKWAFKSD